MTSVTKSKQEIREGLRAIWRHVGPVKKKLVVLMILGLISAAANGFVPFVTGRFFDALIKLSQGGVTSAASAGWPLWASLLLAWVVTQIVANNVDWIMDRSLRRVDTETHFHIQTSGFAHLFRLPLNYHKNVHINGELQKISQASWRVSVIMHTVINIAPQFLSIIIGITLAASTSHLLANVLLAGVLLYVALLIKILLPIAAIDSAAHRSWNESWDNAAAAVQQIESVKQAAAEDYEIKKTHENLFVRTLGLLTRLDRNWSNVQFFQRTIVFLTQLAVFILSVQLIKSGQITVGELVTLNGYALMFFGPFVALGFSWQVIQNGVISAAHAEDIFRRPEEVYVPAEAIRPRLAGQVSFENVSFRYAPDQPEILKQVNFRVNPGQVVALVGESGVGKSTTVSLISGYYFPTTGVVSLDGADTRTLDLVNLRQQIAVVPQEVALFNDTVKANICYGVFDTRDQEIIRVAKEAHIDDFVRTFPKGYETLVGERGIKLSVGQKQRVAIARAILRQPAILILDEPTSALDAGTEKIVTTALEKLMRGRTTFIIAHRLSTVRQADMILVFEKGQIVESGTHQELITRAGGVYRRLYEYQIGLH